MAQLDGLIASLAALSKQLDALGRQIPQLGEYVQDVRFQLLELFGGMEGFSAAWGAYVSAAYSAEEQMEMRRRALQEQFDGLGVSMPENVAGLRALVESQDLNTEAGRSLWAALLQLAPTLREIEGAAEETTTAAEQAAAAVQTLADAYAAAKANTDAAFAAFERGQNKVISRWQVVVEAAQQAADEARGQFDLLHTNTTAMYGAVASTNAMQASQGRAIIAQAVATMRAGGGLPEHDALSEAIASARGGLDENQYASAVDFQRAQLVLAGQLAEMEGQAFQQLTTAEKQLAMAQQQLEVETKQLESMREQIEVMREGNLHTGTMAELATAMMAERAAAAAAEEAKKNPSGGGGKGSGGASFAGGAKSMEGAGYDDYETRDGAASRAAEINAGGGYAYFYNIGSAWRVIDEGMRGGADRAKEMRDNLTTVSSADQWWTEAAKSGATLDD